jgi:hypothetical protein
MKNTIVVGIPFRYPNLCWITEGNNLFGYCDRSLILGPLQDNGGPTPTHALVAGSPAIDAGDNAFAIDPFDNSLLLTDQRGPSFLRIVDSNNDVQQQLISEHLNCKHRRAVLSTLTAIQLVMVAILMMTTTEFLTLWIIVL